MKLTQEQLKDYLKRIGIEKDPTTLKPTLETLQYLHRQQVFHIPFEGLAMHINTPVWVEKPVSIELQDVFDKLVHQKRGGYCFEINQLFYRALMTLGFHVTNHKAKVMWGEGEENGKPKKLNPAHRMLIVHLGDHQYLADVGFGGPGLVEPILISNREAFVDNHHLSIDDEGDYVLSFKLNGQLKPIYAFEQNPVRFEEKDYEGNNLYVSTNPEFIFVKIIVVTMPTSTGRMTLTGNNFVIRENGEKSKTEIKNDVHRVEILNQYFNMDLPKETTFDRPKHGPNILTFRKPALPQKEKTNEKRRTQKLG